MLRSRSLLVSSNDAEPRHAHAAANRPPDGRHLLLVLIGIRLSGKREVSQMTPFDLTLLLLLSNSVQNAMTGPDTSLAGGAVAAATLLVLNYRLPKSPV